MKFLRKPAWTVAGGLFCILLSACGSLPLQSEQILAENPQHLPSQIELTETPFIPQSEYQCGPAALATLFQHNGLDISAEALVPEVYLPAEKGSLQLELISSARRHDLLPYVIDKQVSSLLQELQAGNPVLVLQNLGLSWLPRWHYAVVIGYDLEQDQIYLRSGTERRHVNSFALFERTWRRAGYWGIVVLPVDRLPVTAEPFRYLSSAADFEALGKLEQARTAYYTALGQWPDNKHLHMAAGNVSYRLKDVDEAEVQYRTVTRQWPDYAPAWNNLAQIKYEQGRYTEAEVMIREAIEHGERFQDQYQETLSNIREAKQQSGSP